MPEGDALASHGSQLVGSRQARGRERHACICVQSIANLTLPDLALIRNHVVVGAVPLDPGQYLGNLLGPASGLQVQAGGQKGKQ